jgi:hypothetical protein
MPLLAGTVTVAAGVGAGTGLAKELYDALRADQGIVEGPTMQNPLTSLAKTCNTIASVVITHFKTNATILATPTLTVPAAIPVATAGSATAQTGTTTAPSTATGTVSSTLT